MTDEELKQLNAVYDEPSRYDYLWKDYVEWNETKKKFCEWYNLKIWNQNANKDTLKWCSAYGLTYVYNGNQLVEFGNEWIEFEQDDPRWKWLAFQAERGYPNSWASLQDMMKFFKNRWLIDWFVKCTTAQECKNALNNGCWIYTWSGLCSWSKTSKAKSFVYDANWANHCFSVVDYRSGWLRAVNSFWDGRWNGWYFDIPDDDYWNLFSTYAIVDHDDSGKLQEMRFNMEYQKAIEQKITNWTRPDDPATRKEVAVMIYRATNK